MEVLLVLALIYGIPIAIYLMCVIPALRELKRRRLDDTTQAVWVLGIIAIPIMGALAFWIMQPGERTI